MERNGMAHYDNFDADRWSTCSTAGAIKQYRVYLLFKSVVWEIEKASLPNTAVASHTVWIGERKEYIDSERIQQTAVFFFIFLFLY